MAGEGSRKRLFEVQRHEGVQDGVDSTVDKVQNTWILMEVYSLQ